MPDSDMPENCSKRPSSRFVRTVRQHQQLVVDPRGRPHAVQRCHQPIRLGVEVDTDKDSHGILRESESGASPGRHALPGDDRITLI